MIRPRGGGKFALYYDFLLIFRFYVKKIYLEQFTLDE